MLEVLFVVVPVFALIFAGFLARKSKVLGPHSTRELNRFVVYLALPALLFDIVANAHWREIWRPDFIAVFGLGAAIAFALVLAARLIAKRPLADAAVDGLNGSYSNTGYMGFPLALALFGRDSLPPTLTATILTVCVLFAGALVLIEIGLQQEQGPRKNARLKLAASLASNPLLLSPALGALVMASGFGIPAPVESFLKMLGGAASPCALVALGLFLADEREGVAPAPITIGGLTLMKIIVHPAITWVLATQVFHLSPPLTHVAVLIAALPTGTGPFMAAEHYRRDATLTSKVVLVSTCLSLLTISTYLSFAL